MSVFVSVLFVCGAVADVVKIKGKTFNISNIIYIMKLYIST